MTADRPNTRALKFIMSDAPALVVTPKHKTPNYRLVTHEIRFLTMLGHERHYTVSTWEPVPLRADRKDL
jgi:hypothetical protein